MIHFGIIKSVEQMNRSRPGSSETDADFTSKFCMAAGHEGGHFFMAGLNKFNFVRLFFSPLYCAHDAVYAITGITKDAPHTPLMKPFD
jgi:hypothetical protein